jgi:hypothetical protein
MKTKTARDKPLICHKCGEKMKEESIEWRKVGKVFKPNHHKCLYGKSLQG